jgi:L-lysine 2,3-aminomutase
MNPSDPEDSICKIIEPDLRELQHPCPLDPSAEEKFTVLPGLQHKYPQTALLLVADSCGGICRFCFRKRTFGGDRPPNLCNLSQTAEYLNEQPQVTDILLSGGDPLMLSSSHPDSVLTKIREIAHIPVIRIGTKIRAYDPARIIENPDIPEVIETRTHPDQQVYGVTHFNHPREITDTSQQLPGSKRPEQN